MFNAAPEGFGSTSLSPRINDYADLVYRTKSLLGWPSAPIEITDEQWGHIIDKAIEDFTEFEGNREEEYLVFCSDVYKRNCGVKLDDLLDIGCNTQHCYTTTYTETVTSTRDVYDIIQTSTAYFSATPFEYPTPYNYLNPNSMVFSGISGQSLNLYFDPENPWDAMEVCKADCVTINPLNSRWYMLSSNPKLSATVFNFVTSPLLSGVLDDVIYDVNRYGFQNVPISALGNTVSAIPIQYFPLSAFYSANRINGPAVSACINIANGGGYIYPNCNTSLISSCLPLTAQYGISPSVTASWSNASLNFASATHIQLFGVPACTTDGSIPLDNNNGILGTFTLCNTAFSTNGPMTLKKIQFFNDYKPPVEVLYKNNCNWNNNGFTFTYHNASYGDCIRTTPTRVPVDVTFSNRTTLTEVGTVTATLSSNVDTFLNRKRKILGVFSTDTAGQGGYGGGDQMFNFDYALLANTFGYNMQGGKMGTGQGYDLLTYHMARSFTEHSKKMLRYVSYQFNPRTQYLKMTPEPANSYSGAASGCIGINSNIASANQCYIVGLYLEPPVEHLISSYFIKEYVLALAMITLGRIRSTFGGVTLFGGATLAGETLLTKGNEKADKLLAELRDEMRYSAPPSFFIN
jgi:hypothetical protein